MSRLFKNIIKRTFGKFGIGITRITKTTSKPRTVRWLQHFQYFEKMFELIRNVPGDIVECGAGTGRTFFMLSYLVLTEKEDSKRLLWGFDSFKGFPKPSKEDASIRDPQKGEWNHASEKLILKRLKASHIPDTFIESRVKLVKGYLKDTVSQFPDKPIALLHIDVDLYQSYKDALETLFPKVATGGVVIFDEYQKPKKWPGAKKAVDEYFKNTEYNLQYDSSIGKHYVIKL